VETVAPVGDAALQGELRGILDVYDADNASAWDLRPDGSYVRRAPAEGEPGRAAQDVFEGLAHGVAAPAADTDPEEAAS
jgi:polyphosphate kinase